MIPLMIVCAISGGVAVASVVLGAIALTRAGKLFRLSEEKSATGLANCQSAIESLAGAVEKLSRIQSEMERNMATVAVQAPQKAALNLTKRSQVLRLHRRGDAADQIASVLEVPRQEVDLLIKVHQIVMSNL